MEAGQMSWICFRVDEDRAAGDTESPIKRTTVTQTLPLNDFWIFFWTSERLLYAHWKWSVVKMVAEKRLWAGG